MTFTFARRTLAAFVLASLPAGAAPHWGGASFGPTSIAAAAPHANDPAPAAAVQQIGVHKALRQVDRGPLKGVFGGQKAFADKLAKAMKGDVVVLNPR